MAFSVFVDTNVFLDVLMHRGNAWHDAETILLMAEQKRVAAFTSASALLNLIYVLKTQKLTRAETIQHSTAILRFTRLVNPDNATFESVLHAGYSDLEDAVQYFTALNTPGMDYFITSNKKDFKKAIPLLPVLTPKEFLALHQ